MIVEGVIEMSFSARLSTESTALLRRLKIFIKQYNSASIFIATLLFIAFTLAAAVYANGLVWDFGTAGGAPMGLGSPVSTQSIVNSLNRYDAGHYNQIAEDGYRDPSDAAFMPLYPLAIRATHAVTKLPYAWSGFVVSWVSLCGAAIAIYKWAALELKQRKLAVSPWLVLGIMALFPTAFYLAAPYTESLFIVLTASALLTYRKRQYLPAAVLAALATATRDQGLLLCLYFLADYVLVKKDRHWQKLIPAFVGAAGLLAYMVFLSIHYGSAFEFLSAEQDWGRLSGSLIHNLVSSFRPMYIWFVAVWVAGLWSVWRHLGKAYFIYSLAFILLPLASGSFLSVNRFTLSLLPIFLGLAIFGELSAPKLTKSLYIASSTFLLAWSLLLFANDYWVA